MEAYKRLSKILNDNQWEIKKKMRTHLDRLKQKIKDETLMKLEKENYVEKIQNMKEEMEKNIASFISSLLSDIRHYFKCSGCSKCSAEVRNRHFLRDYKSEFERDVTRFGIMLNEEVNQSSENLRADLAASIYINKLSSQMDSLIKMKVQELIEKMIAQSRSELTEVKKKRSFDDLWNTVTDEILTKIDRKEKEIDIKASVQNIITSLLGPDVHRYHKKKQQMSTDTTSNSANTYDEKGFDLQESHVTRGNPVRLKERTATIVEQTSSHCRIVTGGKEYGQKDAETLFNDILTRIKHLKEEGIDTSLDYKVDLIIYMEELAVRNFILNQKTYVKKSSHQALLQKKREIYYKIFDAELGQGNSLVEMMNSLLKGIVESNLDDRLTHTELMQILRDHDGDVFRNTQALQASIMVDLLAKNNFKEYLRYITDYEEVIRETLAKKSIESLEEDNHLKRLAKSKLSSIVEELKQAIKKTVVSPNKDFIGTLFSNMKGLKKPHNDIEAYKMVTLDNKAKFADILIIQLTSSIQKQLEKDIDTWKVSSIIDKKGLTDFAFNEIVGCTKKCPFCKAPCDAHSGGKTSGNHRATLHRPRGLGRKLGTETRQLKAYDCNEGVASPSAKFRTKKGAQYIMLRDYRKVYKDWTIEPITDDERELYWKRVLRDFNKEFAQEWNGSEALIPGWWHKIQDHRIEEDLARNYGISRDEIRRTFLKAKRESIEACQSSLHHLL